MNKLDIDSIHKAIDPQSSAVHEFRRRNATQSALASSIAASAATAAAMLAFRDMPNHKDLLAKKTRLRLYEEQSNSLKDQVVQLKDQILQDENANRALISDLQSQVDSLTAIELQLRDQIITLEDQIANTPQASYDWKQVLHDFSQAYWRASDKTDSPQFQLLEQMMNDESNDTAANAEIIFSICVDEALLAMNYLQDYALRTSEYRPGSSAGPECALGTVVDFDSDLPREQQMLKTAAHLKSNLASFTEWEVGGRPECQIPLFNQHWFHYGGLSASNSSMIPASLLAKYPLTSDRSEEEVLSKAAWDFGTHCARFATLWHASNPITNRFGWAKYPDNFADFKTSAWSTDGKEHGFPFFTRFSWYGVIEGLTTSDKQELFSKMREFPGVPLEEAPHFDWYQPAQHDDIDFWMFDWVQSKPHLSIGACRVATADTFDILNKPSTAYGPIGREYGQKIYTHYHDCDTIERHIMNCNFSETAYVKEKYRLDSSAPCNGGYIGAGAFVEATAAVRGLKLADGRYKADCTPEFTRLFFDLTDHDLNGVEREGDMKVVLKVQGVTNQQLTDSIRNYGTDAWTWLRDDFIPNTRSLTSTTPVSALVKRAIDSADSDRGATFVDDQLRAVTTSAGFMTPSDYAKRANNSYLELMTHGSNNGRSREPNDLVNFFDIEFY